MRLQAQAHRLWDTLHFAIVPRPVIGNRGQIEWHTQMMNEDEELESDWPRKHLQPYTGGLPNASMRDIPTVSLLDPLPFFKGANHDGWWSAQPTERRPPKHSAPRIAELPRCAKKKGAHDC